MHDILIEKSADKRIIEKLKQTPTTIFSNNPFDSTRKLFIREDKDNINDKIYLDFLGNSDDIINEPVIELNNIEKLRIEYSLVDFKKNPQNPFLANNVGLAYLGGKDITKAIEYFNLALNLDPTFRAAKLNLANAYKQTGRFKEAIELYENMLSNNKDDKGVLINLGNLYLMTVQIQLAEKYLSLVWNDNRNDVDVGNKLAIINLLKGNFNNSVSILRDCIKNSPDNSAIYNTLGIAYVFSKLNKKAIQAFKSSLNLSPSYTPALLNLVERMIRDGQIKEALDITESFCEKFDDSSAREVLAKLYLFSGSYHRCLIVLRQIYSRLIESNSPYGEQARVMNNIGVVYHKMGDLVNAELFYLESLKMSDDDPKIVLSNLIDIYFFTEKLESALKYINRFKQKYPNDKIHLYYQARYSALKNSFVDSIEYLKDFLGHEKRFAEAYGLLSYIYSEIESNYAEAINILDSAMLQLPDNILIINNLAYNYLMINNINKAREILQKVENIDDDIFLTATRGLLALKENNLDYGRYLYNKAIGMSKDLSLKTDIEQKKNIEIAKYFLKQGSRSQAIDLLKKVSISKNTIFTRQAQNLLNSLENIN